MAGILILAEAQGSRIKKTSFELASKASELAAQIKGDVTALLIGYQVGDCPVQLAPYGVKRVLVADRSELQKYNTLEYLSILKEAVKITAPQVVLASASPMGKDLMPRLSAALAAGLASDVVDLRVDGGRLVATKPLYSGKVLANVVIHSPVQLVTVRPNSFVIREVGQPAACEVTSMEPSLNEIHCPLVDVIKGESLKADLTEAEIIISGGRAMGKAENFALLKECADVIGATVGASRAAVDSGYAPHDMQVGQTGKVVNPKLYIACGISGAIQHLAGMRTSKVIVAINKDPEAPIFSKSDYGIVGDLFTVIPLLTQEFRKILSE